MSIANPTLEDVWQLFRENAAQQRENAAQQREIAARQKENDRQFQELRQESDRRFQETERLLKIQSQETDRRFQETERFIKEQFQESARYVKELSQKTKELENLFTSQWGRLVESLVEGALVRLFNAWGLPVQRTATRVKGRYQNQNYEFDILAHNGEAVVIIEVKTTLRPNHVKHFTKKLEQAKIWLPEYTNNDIYGAMAFLHADAQAQEMAIKQKLFAIRATGDSAHIVNAPEFKPKIW